MGYIGRKAVAGTVAAILLQGAFWGTAANASEAGGSKTLIHTVSGVTQTFAGAAAAGDARFGDYATGAIPNAISQTSPSVVAIIGKQAGSGATSGRFDLVHGTGVVVKSNGTIMTNAHVVKDMEHIVVVTYDGKQYNGRTTHLDEESDLALVQIDATGLKEAVFAAKADTQVGDTVIAIGTPISFSLRNSVTVGVISGLDRSVNSTYRLLQTDAAINPGNSGGALVNLKGEVVGINTLKYADYGVDNLGFAIPADTVQYVLKHFLTYGKVKRPYVGLELEESWAGLVGIPTEEPLSISVIEAGSPADKAGIKAGDKLLSVGGDRIHNLVEFNELLKRYLPGDSAELTVQTAGGTLKKTVVFGEVESAGTALSGGDGGSAGAFDSDEGKTRIGDSRYGWSMKYPPELDISFQSDNGDSITLSDAKGEYSIHITSLDKTQDYSRSALLKLLAAKEDGSTILERKYIAAAGQSYAKIVSKDSYGYYESRAYVSDKHVTYVTMSVSEESDFNNSIKRKGYSELLDSFSFTFDKKDPSIKNVAVDQDGYRTHKQPDYGYSIAVPASWTGPDYSEEPVYTDDSGDRSAEVRMTSLGAGDTLDKWVSRLTERYESQYAPDYLEAGDITDAKLAGLPAKEWTVSVKHGAAWTTSRMFFLADGGYKYQIIIDYPQDTGEKEAEDLVSRIAGSFQMLPGSRNKALGYLTDDQDLTDYGTTAKVTGKLGFSLEVPEYWEANPYRKYSQLRGEVEGVDYGFTGGRFILTANKGNTLDTAINDTKKANDIAEDDPNMSVTASLETVFGVPAQKYVLRDNTKSKPREVVKVIFFKEGVTYQVEWSLEDANRTDANLEALHQAFESLQFNAE